MTRTVSGTLTAQYIQIIGITTLPPPPLVGPPEFPCQLNMDMANRVATYEPGRNSAVMNASAFMEELSRVLDTAMPKVSRLSSCAEVL
jgi:hypothetical protein